MHDELLRSERDNNRALYETAIRERDEWKERHHALEKERNQWKEVATESRQLLARDGWIQQAQTAEARLSRAREALTRARQCIEDYGNPADDWLLDVIAAALDDKGEAVNEQDLYELRYFAHYMRTHESIGPGDWWERQADRLDRAIDELAPPPPYSGVPLGRWEDKGYPQVNLDFYKSHIAALPADREEG